MMMFDSKKRVNLDSPHFDAGAQLFYCRMFLLLPEKLVNGPNGIGKILGIQKFFTGIKCPGKRDTGTAGCFIYFKQIRII